MRIGRLLAGAIIILSALWIIIGEQITGVSSDAVVNARLSTVRSPIAGTLEMPWRPLGSRVATDEVLVTVADPLVDTIRLRDLELERLLALAERVSLERRLEAVGNAVETLSDRLEVYREQRLRDLKTRLARARERVALLGGTGLAPAVLRSESGLSGSASDVPVDADTTALSFALQDVETLEIVLAAAIQGVFLGDGYNDAPFSEQKLVDRQAEADALSVELTQTEDRIAAIDTRIAAERRRTNLLASATLPAPTDGILWEVLASDREVVQRGQDVLKIMDCDSALVTLSVPDTVYNRLRVGQSAKFRLNQTNKLYDGTITRIAGSGAETIYRNLAVAPSIKHLERYDVALLVPGLRENTDLVCTVGQTGRVFFETRPLDWLRNIFG